MQKRPSIRETLPREFNQPCKPLGTKLKRRKGNQTQYGFPKENHNWVGKYQVVPIESTKEPTGSAEHPLKEEELTNQTENLDNL